MQTVILNIGGMTCGGCADSVTRVLTDTAGVAHVQVNLEHASATVQFDAAQTDVAQLIDAIENAGFDAQAA